jgi:molybdate transport system ATP-binding protein
MLEVTIDIAKEDFRLSLKARIHPGITGVFGPSGVGKTTLLNCILGLEQAQQVICGSRTLADEQHGVMVATHRRNIAAVFQESRLFPNKSVLKNLCFAGMDPRDPLFAEVVGGLNLEQLLTKSVAQLSGGEAQRVALGRALLARPDWLLLDEPLVSLDRGAQRRILHFLKDIHESWNLPMLFVSHNLSELLFLTQNLLLLKPGGLLAHGRYHEVLKEPEVLTAMHDLGLVNVLRLHVAEHRASEGVTILKTGSLTWVAPLCAEPIGSELDVSLRPEDIALIARPVADISVQNQMKGTVRHIVTAPERALVYLDVGVELIAEVTLQAVHSLALQPGQSMVGLFKAQALKILK